MTTRSKTIIAAAAFAVISSQAFSQVGCEFRSGMAYMYGGPGKLSAMAYQDRNERAMMMHAAKLPAKTVLFMKAGELYSTSGTFDTAGDFHQE